MCFDYGIEKIERERENKEMIAPNEESTRIAPQSENTKEQPIRYNRVIGSKNTVILFD